MNRIIILHALTIAIVSIAQAQAPNASGSLDNSLTLEQAVELALEKNPDLQAIREELDLARAGSVIARQNTLNPQLKFEYEGDNFTEKEGIQEVRFGLSLNLELRGQRGWRKRMSESGEISAEQRLRQAEWELRSVVKVAFHGLQFLNQSIELATKRLDVSRRLMDVAEARLERQQIPEMDANFVRLEYYQAANAHLRITGKRSIAQGRLLRLLGLPNGSGLNVIGEFEPKEEWDVSDSALLERAIASRGDLAALQAEVERAESRIGLERALVWPGAEVGFSYRREDDLVDVGGFQRFKRDRHYGFEVSVPFPILYQRSGEIREAKAVANIQRARFNALKLSVRMEVSETAQLVRILRKTLANYESKLSILSEQNLVDIERAFVAGEVGTIEVLKAQSDFVEVTQNYYDVLLEYLEAEATLEAVVGPPLSLSNRGLDRNEK